MSEHISNWLNAYLDGELYGKRLIQVEAHLSECPECQAELASLQALSGILHESLLPDFPPAERYAANVVLSLPRKPAGSLPQMALEVTWWLTPVALTLAWVFIHTTLVLSNWVGAAGSLGLLNTTDAAWLLPAAPQGMWFASMLTRFGLMNNNNLFFLNLFESIADSITLQVAIGLIYIGWIVTWWARQRRRGYGQPLAAGNGSPVK